MRTPTKPELMTRVQELENDNGNLFLALQDVTEGKVKWFRKGKAKIGIIRPCGASGGIVILCHSTVSVQDWETWFRNICELTPHSDEDLHWRDVAYMGRQYVNECQATLEKK